VLSIGLSYRLYIYVCIVGGLWLDAYKTDWRRFWTTVKAKFHYAIWSHTGSKLVADLQLALDDRPNFCSLQVCDQLRTGLRPDSVMEFGLYHESYTIENG